MSRRRRFVCEGISVLQTYHPCGIERVANHHLPRVLFARTAYYHSQNEFALAWADLEEAREIAERGEMKLHLADYHLQACRLYLAQHSVGASGPLAPTTDHLARARNHLEAAAKMIKEMGYGRRKPEVEGLRQQLQSI